MDFPSWKSGRFSRGGRFHSHWFLHSGHNWICFPLSLLGVGSFWYIHVLPAISYRILQVLIRLRTVASKHVIKKQNNVLEKNCAQTRELIIGTPAVLFRTGALTRNRLV